MVKDAVEQMKTVMSENKDRRGTAPAAAAHHGATITSLRDEAASFAKVQEQVKSDEKSYSGKH